ncbi:hypothetical protein B9Z55_002453 [Caenorhabditis nigoni]|nr:hypothetical protein B9Z55_002453 [Caenorhabditis nigoni]
MGDRNVVPARVQNVLDMDIVRLNLWSIQFVDSGVILEGFVRSEDGNMMQKVRSGMICKRMTATMLFDFSGCFFELSGQIDREYQQKMGMPSRVIDEFTSGFPENWVSLIKSFLPVNPISAVKHIQPAPREPLRPISEPIVTLPDETTLESEKDQKRREKEERLEKKRLEEERLEKERREQKLRAQKEKERREAVAAAEAEKKRLEEEEDAANYTIRVPKSQSGEAITPIRFTRGNGQKGANVRPIFDKTPVREKTAGPLASSTPQAPPPQQRLSNVEKKPASPEPQPRNPQRDREIQYASDSDLFAVPKLPAPKTTKPSTTSEASSGGVLDFLDEMDTLFDTVVVEQTPTRDRRPPRRYSRSPSPRRRQHSSSRDMGKGYDNFESSRYSQRYNDNYNTSRMSRRDDTFRRNDERRDESRMSRKRVYNNSPDDFEYNNRYDDRSRRPDYYDSDSRYDSKRSRPRETSSSSGRSVRFEDDYRRNHRDPRDRSDSKDYRNYDESRRNPEDRREEKRKLNDILRREEELVTRLQNRKKPSASYRREPSSDEDDTADEWDRENQEILDNSMMFGDGLSQKKRRSAGRPSKPSKKERQVQPKPVRKPPQPKKKQKSPPDELNDSIASNRPRRACVTPSTPAPKRIVWPKRDLDRLKHTIGLKKPTGSDADWAEVTRLLAKEGVDAEVVKQVAITRLKWKEPAQDPETIQREEEEEKKRRRGVAARVKEGVKLHEELRQPGVKRGDNSQTGVEAMEDYEPDDVAADQSLLALQTPVGAKRKGGTRASIMPEPVEDSPLVRRNNSTFNSPRLDQTKAKEVETTLKYVQHLSMMNARPSSRANTSYYNKSSSRGGGSKNTSMSLEQGTRKALKIINRGRTIHEEDEDEDDDDDDEDQYEDGVVY